VYCSHVAGVALVATATRVYGAPVSHMHSVNPACADDVPSAPLVALQSIVAPADKTLGDDTNMLTPLIVNESPDARLNDIFVYTVPPTAVVMVACL
jgi:hypothetical protein